MSAKTCTGRRGPLGMIGRGAAVTIAAIAAAAAFSAGGSASADDSGVRSGTPAGYHDNGVPASGQVATGFHESAVPEDREY